MIIVDEDLFNAEEKVDELLDKLTAALERRSKYEISSLQGQIAAAYAHLKKLQGG